MVQKMIAVVLYTCFHLEFAFNELGAERRDALCGDVFALWFVFGHFVLQGDEADGGALFLLQAEELQDALVVVNVAVNENEQNLDREAGRWSASDLAAKRLNGAETVSPPDP